MTAGYGFVDFENDVSAENAVKGLLAKGINAQMAKVGISSMIRRTVNVSIPSFFFLFIPSI